MFVNLSSAANAILTSTNGRAVAYIPDDDPPPALSINDVTLAEGNCGSSTFVFTVSLSAASSKTVRVNTVTSDGTALTSTNDYVGTGNHLIFAPGEATKTVTVQVTGDARDEYDETFAVNLWIDSIYAEYASIADGQGRGHHPRRRSAAVVDNQ